MRLDNGDMSLFNGDTNNVTGDMRLDYCDMTLFNGDTNNVTGDMRLQYSDMILFNGDTNNVTGDMAWRGMRTIPTHLFPPAVVPIEGEEVQDGMAGGQVRHQHAGLPLHVSRDKHDVAILVVDGAHGFCINLHLFHHQEKRIFHCWLLLFGALHDPHISHGNVAIIAHKH